MILLRRAAHLFETTVFRALPRELWLQAAAALLAALPGAMALHFARGPLFVQLAVCGLVFGAAYVAGLWMLGLLPARAMEAACASPTSTTATRAA